MGCTYQSHPQRTAVDLVERLCRDIVVAEVRMIEHVKQIDTELQSEPFGQLEVLID